MSGCLCVCAAQDKYFQQTLNVLTAFRSSELDKAVASLSAIEVDVLMKYLYRAFSEPTEKSCAIILQWHEKVSVCPCSGHWHGLEMLSWTSMPGQPRGAPLVYGHTGQDLSTLHTGMGGGGVSCLQKCRHLMTMCVTIHWVFKVMPWV